MALKWPLAIIIKIEYFLEKGKVERTLAFHKINVVLIQLPPQS